MTFLNPFVLLGLAAAAIPLIIHLFNFRRPRRVDFSSLAFVKELERSTMQRVRIKQWLLLLLRTLAIACLVLAFARPTLTGDLAGGLGGRAPTSVALVVDNSLSMQLRDARGGYLDQARALAAGLLDQMEPADEVFVVPTAGDGRADAFRNRSAAREAVAALEPQPGARSLARALETAVRRLEEGAHPNREVYLLTDLQRSTLVDTLEGRLPDELPVLLVPVGTREHANVAVTDVMVESRIVETGEPVELTATLVNYGLEAAEGYGASVYLGGERVAQATADLPPGRPTHVRFTATPPERGWLRGAVEIEDDAFPDDNTRHFTLHVPEQRRVLLVRGEGQSTRYLELALSRELTRGRAAFEVETVPETALAAAGLGTYDAVALVGPRSLSSGEVASLARYVEEGGGLLFFPDAQAPAEDYNALFDALGGGRFTGFTGELGQARTVASFERTDLEHPLFRGVFEQTGGAVEQPDVYFAMNYTPASGGEQTLIRLSGGRPFLQEVRHGRGAALLMAVAPDPRWSDLPVRGLFVPLVYRSVYYLSAGESVAGEQLEAGRPAELRVAGAPDGAPLRLVAPGGEELTPEQRDLFGAVLLQLRGELRTPGVYDVRAGERLVRRVALNLDAREPDLRTLPAAEAAEALAAATGASVRVLEAAGETPERVMETLRRSRLGVELWNVFLVLALAFLLAETAVARQWRPEAVPA